MRSRLALCFLCIAVLTGQEDCGTKDIDGDGYAPVDGDCDDRNPNVNPGAVEICGDGLDNDCDGGAGDCALEGLLPLSSADLSIAGTSAGDQLGSAMASAGDLNGDGFDDLLVGSPSSDGEAGEATGHVYVIFGPQTGGAIDVGTAGAVISGTVANENLGTGVAGAGDVNGDGYDDILISAPFGEGNGSGSVYLFYGPLSGSLTSADADAVLMSDAADDSFGMTLGTAGDINGDGNADIYVGAPTSGRVDVEGGALFVFWGPLSGAIDAEEANGVLNGDGAYWQVGASVSQVGDLNGDGTTDLLVGAPGANTNAGQAALYLGPIDGEMAYSSAALLFNGLEGQLLGATVSGLGDINDDGTDDIAVGAPNASFRGDQTGAVYVWTSPFEAGQYSSDEAPLSLNGGGIREHAGSALAKVGDVNGDGRADLLVGAVGEAPGPGERGARKVYLVCRYAAGNQTLATACGVVEADEDGPDVGGVISDAGDLNADGQADFAIGVPTNSLDEASTGTGYIYFGRSGI